MYFKEKDPEELYVPFEGSFQNKSEHLNPSTKGPSTKLLAKGRCDSHFKEVILLFMVLWDRVTNPYNSF